MMTENASYLLANVGKLEVKDQVFAASLLAQLQKKGTLSAKQWYWVDKLAERAKDPVKAKVAEVKANTEDLGNFAGVIDLFNKAKSAGLKDPAITLALGDDTPLVLSLTGEKSKAPGSVNLTDGGSFNNNKWYGRVSPEGQWLKGRGHDEDTMTAISIILTALADDPQRMAHSYGKKTHRCCFCRIPLDDPKSKEAGYGPTCAKNWGLPWGNKLNKKEKTA
jgi:hypothetical protein